MILFSVYSQDFPFFREYKLNNLQNPDGFELVHKTKRSPGNRFHAVEFPLPEHLNFGEWKIVARPDHQRSNKRQTYSVTFDVQNYGNVFYIINIIIKCADIFLLSNKMKNAWP